MGGPEMFFILRVGGKVRPPQVIVYGENCMGGWSKKNYNSADGWSDKNYNSAGVWSEKLSLVTPTTNFFNGIALNLCLDGRHTHILSEKCLISKAYFKMCLLVCIVP